MTHPPPGWWRRISDEELLSLPDQTKVRVTWSGGNGPHIYNISTLDPNHGTPLSRPQVRHPQTDYVIGELHARIQLIEVQT